MLNIDRERNERYAGGTETTRTTREWALSLKTPDGTSLRCDVENGGKDQRAYLLAPTKHLEIVKLELQKYLQSLNSSGNTYAHRSPNTEGGATAARPTRPTEIYIPTPAVLKNLQFLNTLSSEEVWKCAPAAIRTSPTTQPARNPVIAKGTSDNMKRNAVGNHHQTLLAETSKLQTPINDNNVPATNLTDFPPLQSLQRQDDTTVGTTASNITRNTHAQNQNHYDSKFKEIDAQIKQHQQEFQAIHTRFDSINDQLLRNMMIASDHSKQFTHLEKQVNEVNEALKILLQRTDASTLSTSVSPTQQKHHTQAHHTTITNFHEPVYTQPIAPYDREERENVQGHSSMSVASTSSQSRNSIESIPIMSPEKKRIRQTTQPPSNPHSDEQETSARYNDCTPADTDL